MAAQGLADRQNSLESLKAVEWKDFEYLVSEAYRRQGYQVSFSLGRGADGGVDLELWKGGRTSLVQCKQWRTLAVVASMVRQLFGIMTAEKADEAIIVTSGRFTNEAVNFAQGKPIQLVDGPRLLQLVKRGQERTLDSRSDGNLKGQAAAPPSCPKCGKPMILKTARRGQNAGNKFWGCQDYPRCNGTRGF